MHEGGVCEDNYNGLLAFQRERSGVDVTPIRGKTGDPALCVNAVEGIAADYDVVVCFGFLFSGIAEAAEDNPDTKFILIDACPTDDSGKEVEISNINAMKFKEEESGFFAGMAAALSTKTKKVAVVNGIAFPSNVNYQYAFMSGVNYVNMHYGADVKILGLLSYSGTDVTGKNAGGNYISSFADQANGKIVGQALIREGCDVIFVAAASAGMG